MCSLAVSTANERLSVAQHDGWSAELALRFAPGHGRTRLHRDHSFGPLYVQKPFYPEADLAHVYLLHPPGGVAAGDNLNIRVAAEDGSGALLTTPAATKFYRSLGRVAEVTTTLSVSENASLEWLPQENIFFNDCAVNLNTTVELAPGARFISWEINCFGRPASGEQFSAGNVTASLGISQHNHSQSGTRPLLLEHNRWQAGDELMQAPWGLAGCGVTGALYAAPADQEVVSALRSKLPDSAAEASRCAVTLVENILIARVLGNSGIAARAYLETVWQTLRPMILQRPASVPRIWNT